MLLYYLLLERGKPLISLFDLAFHNMKKFDRCTTGGGEFVWGRGLYQQLFLKKFTALSRRTKCDENELKCFFFFLEFECSIKFLLIFTLFLNIYHVNNHNCLFREQKHLDRWLKIAQISPSACMYN